MRYSPHILPFLAQFLLLASCAALFLLTACAPRIGYDGYRVITKGTAYKEDGMTRDSTMKKARTDAQSQMGSYIEDYPELKKNMRARWVETSMIRS